MPKKGKAAKANDECLKYFQNGANTQRKTKAAQSERREAQMQ